jgi:hypothetical protein
MHTACAGAVNEHQDNVVCNAVDADILLLDLHFLV